LYHASDSNRCRQQQSILSVLYFPRLPYSSPETIALVTVLKPIKFACSGFLSVIEVAADPLSQSQAAVAKGTCRPASLHHPRRGDAATAKRRRPLRHFLMETQLGNSDNHFLGAGFLFRSILTADRFRGNSRTKKTNPVKVCLQPASLLIRRGSGSCWPGALGRLGSNEIAVDIVGIKGHRVSEGRHCEDGYQP
jgi:hypothetical protein